MASLLLWTRLACNVQTQTRSPHNTKNLPNLQVYVLSRGGRKSGDGIEAVDIRRDQREAAGAPRGEGPDHWGEPKSHRAPDSRNECNEKAPIEFIISEFATAHKAPILTCLGPNLRNLKPIPCRLWSRKKRFLQFFPNPKNIGPPELICVCVHCIHSFRLSQGARGHIFWKLVIMAQIFRSYSKYWVQFYAI